MAKKSKITITLDDDLLKQLRDYRSKTIKKNLKGISFSQIIEDLTKIGLKNAKKQGIKVIVQVGGCSTIAAGICINHGIGHSFHVIGNLL